MTVSILIAVLALLFTVASFWWLNARSGRLLGSIPTTFAMFFDNSTARFRIPVILYNTGAKTTVVESLRLAIIGSGNEPLEWVTTGTRLRPIEGEKDDFATPFAIEGRRVIRIFPDFKETPPSWRPQPGSTHQMAIQAYTLGKRQWRTVVEFPLAVPRENLDRFIVHRNAAAQVR